MKIIMTSENNHSVNNLVNRMLNYNMLYKTDYTMDHKQYLSNNETKNTEDKSYASFCLKTIITFNVQYEWTTEIFVYVLTLELHLGQPLEQFDVRLAISEDDFGILLWHS